MHDNLNVTLKISQGRKFVCGYNPINYKYPYHQKVCEMPELQFMVSSEGHLITPEWFLSMKFTFWISINFSCVQNGACTLQSATKLKCAPLLRYYTVIQHYSETFRKYGSLFLYFVLNDFSAICNVNSCTSALVFWFFKFEVKCAAALET